MKDFAQLAAPLHALTGKYVRFQWSDECQMAFERLQAALTLSPILAIPTDGDVYVLDTDASEQSNGAVLYQKQGVEEKVMAYASRAYSRAQQNYCTTRKEVTGSGLLYEALPAVSAGTPCFGPDGSRRVDVVTKGDRLDGSAKALARTPAGIRFRHRTPYRIQARKRGRIVATAVRTARVLSNNNYCRNRVRSATNSGSRTDNDRESAQWGSVGQSDWATAVSYSTNTIINNKMNRLVKHCLVLWIYGIRKGYQFALTCSSCLNKWISKTVDTKCIHVLNSTTI